MSVKEPQPEVHIRGDGEVRYEAVGRVVVACQRAGISKVGFITEPPAGTGHTLRSTTHGDASGLQPAATTS